MISLKRGHTDPKAVSNFWVKEASLDGVGAGVGEADGFGKLMGISSGLEGNWAKSPADVFDMTTTLISPLGFSPRDTEPSASLNIPVISNHT